MISNLNNVSSGIYNSVDDIKNFKIRIKLKKIPGTISAYSNDTTDLTDTEFESKTIAWQEKQFSKSEIQFYSHENNCVTDQEKEYYEKIKNISEPTGRLFTYIHNDEFSMTEEGATTSTENEISYLQRRMSNIKLQESPNNHKMENFDFLEHLGLCLQNPVIESEYEIMYVMADLGNSEDDSNIWLKSEYILCTLKYDKRTGILIVYPDFSRDLRSPYSVRAGFDRKNVYEYFIEHASDVPSEKLLNKQKLLQRQVPRRNIIRSQMIGTKFSMPPKDTLRVYVFLEILSAKGFEHGQAYVQYNLDLPENWSVLEEGALCGTTQSCRSKFSENTRHYNACFDFCLELDTQHCDTSGFPARPCLYLQVISHDDWHRFRTAGIAYQTLPVLEPGVHEYQLRSVRLCPRGISGNLRRFFIGDYSNIDDISWIGLPKYYDESVLNKYGVPTEAEGIVEIRVNILNQRGAQLASATSHGAVHRPPAHSLVKSVEDVVLAFRRAQERMHRARANILKQD